MYFLKDNILYHFHGQELFPSRLVFLLGCYIKEIDTGVRFGFLITHDYSGFRPKKLFCATKSQRDSWVVELKKASCTTDVEDEYKLVKVIGTGKFS